MLKMLKEKPGVYILENNPPPPGGEKISWCIEKGKSKKGEYEKKKEKEK